MPVEFSLLSMTELRNGPGEILDRVADKGEAFIIERNGQRKACLVPLSMFFPDISPSRVASELEELVRHDEEPRTTVTSDREIVFRFRGDSELETALWVNIVLPHGYPNRCPRVHIDGLADKAPHRWADGTLCLYGVMSAWNPGKHTVHYTLTLARRWLENYSTWKATGRWPETGSRDD
jgi:prevent-host-death family protein